MLSAPALSAESAPKFAYVTNQNSETVSVVDLETFKVMATIGVPGKCAGVAVSPVTDRVYVTCPDAHDVAVIDTTSNAVIARWPAGKGPLGIAVQPVTGRLFVADWYDKIVRVLDPATGAFKAEIEVGQSPSGIDFWAEGGVAVVADRDSNEISVVDGDSFKRIAHIRVGERPFGVALNKNSKKGAYEIFAANVGSDDVSYRVYFCDLPDRPYCAERPLFNETLPTALFFTPPPIKVGRRPYAVALSGMRAFVTDQYGGTVSVIDLAPLREQPKTLKRTAVIDACDHPEGINYDASRKAVYVACWFDNKLIRIDAESLKITGEVAVGDGPRAFGDFLK